MSRNRPLEIIAAALLTYILFVSFSIVPVIGGLLAVLSPIPLVISYHRAGKVPFLLAFAAAVTLISLTMDIPAALFFAVTIGPMAAITSEGLSRQVAMPKVVFWCITAVLLSLALLVGGIVVNQGVNPVALLHQHVSSNLEDTIKVYRELKMNSDDIDLLAANIPLIADTFVRLFPSIALISIAGAAFSSYFISSTLLVRLGLIQSTLRPFPLWVIPDYVVWGVIAGGGLLLIPWTAAKSIGGNILIPLLSAYLVQGLSVVAFFFTKWQFHPLLRALGYFLITTQVFLLIPVLSLGVFDTWADFRKLRKPAASARDSELT